jgi:hypothetical protein
MFKLHDNLLKKSVFLHSNPNEIYFFCLQNIEKFHFKIKGNILEFIDFKSNLYYFFHDYLKDYSSYMIFHFISKI